MQAARFLVRACVFVLLAGCACALRAESPRFHVIALAEKSGIHKPFVDAAKVWLAQEAVRDHFTVDYIEDTKPIDDAFLSRYQLFIQLNFPPYNWTPTAAAAFERYIDEGRGGWIGFHHATLLGHFDGFAYGHGSPTLWAAFGSQDYIATFATGTVHVEDTHHPAMQSLPASFRIENEEWYTWDKDPRPNVHVLATVDENSYTPQTK